MPTDSRRGFPLILLITVAFTCLNPAVLTAENPQSWEQKKAERLRVARQIVELEPDERLKVWKEKTDSSRATMYRCLARLAQLDAQEIGP